MGYQTIEWTAIMGDSDCIGCLMDNAQADSMNYVLLACWNDLYNTQVFVWWVLTCHYVRLCDDFFYCLFRSDGESGEESEEKSEESEDDYETRTAQASMYGRMCICGMWCVGAHVDSTISHGQEVITVRVCMISMPTIWIR